MSGSPRHWLWPSKPNLASWDTWPCLATAFRKDFMRSQFGPLGQIIITFLLIGLKSFFLSSLRKEGPFVVRNSLVPCPPKLTHLAQPKLLNFQPVPRLVPVRWMNRLSSFFGMLSAEVVCA